MHGVGWGLLSMAQALGMRLGASLHAGQQRTQQLPCRHASPHPIPACSELRLALRLAGELSVKHGKDLQGFAERLHSAVHPDGE